MPLINFDDSLKLGIPEIDKQHEFFVYLTNKLHKEISEDISYEDAIQYIDELFKYAKYHFSKEEFYFKRYGYVNLPEHVNEHNKFVNDIEKFRKEYLSDSASLPYDILSFMANWFVTHIKESDMKYRDLFIQKGMEKLINRPE